MLPDKNVMCHYTGFSKSCRSIVAEHTCPKFINILGTNPQTGDHVDRWGCADSVMHFLLLENSQQQRQTAAAVESFRNEMVELNKASLVLALQNRGPKEELLLPGATGRNT